MLSFDRRLRCGVDLKGCFEEAVAGGGCGGCKGVGVIDLRMILLVRLRLKYQEWIGS